MRIGILTYHYVFNEGAIWQACSLCRYLRRRFPSARVEVIDYRHRTKYETLAVRRSPALKALYEGAMAPCLADTRIVDDSPDALFAHLDRCYDAVVVGSDIVWQFDTARPSLGQWRSALETFGPPRPVWTGLRPFARSVWHWMLAVHGAACGSDPTRIPAPNAYWLSPSLRPLKFAYAASIGYSDPGRLDPARQALFLNRLRGFDRLSVRDRQTLGFVAGLDAGLAARVSQVPDPAWLWEEPLPDVQAVLRDRGVDPGTPWAGVMCPPNSHFGRKILGWALPVLRERGFRTVSIITSCPQTDVDLGAEELSPFAWWSVVREMDFLLTVRTHPSIAALMYETPLFNIDTTALYARATASKSADMLGAFGLADRCLFLRRDFHARGVRAGMERALDGPWDWAAIRSRIEAHRASAGAYVAEWERRLS